MLPSPALPDSVLAKHEASVFAECRDVTKAHGHRSEEFAACVLPRCTTLIEAAATRMACEAALSEGVPTPLVDLYVCQALKDDLAWYVEAGLLTRAGFMEQECVAFDAAGPLMESFIDAMGVNSYVHAPIVTDLKWAHFSGTLPLFLPAGQFDYGSSFDSGCMYSHALPQGDSVLVMRSFYNVRDDADYLFSIGCAVVARATLTNYDSVFQCSVLVFFDFSLFF